MAASDVDTYGTNRDNVTDAGQGLIPRAISDPNVSSDEFMLGISSLFNVGPDVYQAVSPQDNTKALGGHLFKDGGTDGSKEDKNYLLNLLRINFKST